MYKTKFPIFSYLLFYFICIFQSQVFSEDLPATTEEVPNWQYLFQTFDQEVVRVKFPNYTLVSEENGSIFVYSRLNQERFLMHGCSPSQRIENHGEFFSELLKFYNNSSWGYVIIDYDIWNKDQNSYLKLTFIRPDIKTEFQMLYVVTMNNWYVLESNGPYENTTDMYIKFFNSFKILQH